MMIPSKTRAVRSLPSIQRGMTLVELLVAMAIGLLIVLITVATLTASRQGATVVDAAAQLRDDGRFASDIIQRLAVQTGFEDLASATAAYAGSAAAYKLKNMGSTGGAIDIKTLQPNVFGFNNATPTADGPLDTATPRSPGDGGNGSDVLVLQYQAVKSVLNAVGGSADGSMISCMGTPSTSAPTGRDNRMNSVLYVGPSAGEPALMCATQNESGVIPKAQPLIKGVESFQVLYGVDNVTPGTKLGAANTADSVADRFLRADQLTVPGDQSATYANWRRVRSIRVGMVLRGPANSAQTSELQTNRPFGAVGFDSPSDPGSSYTVTDNRLRQTVTFTVQLRNCQNQGFQPTTSTLPCDVTLP